MSGESSHKILSFSLMRKKGLEPSLGYPNMNLNHACLPIPALPHMLSLKHNLYNNSFSLTCQILFYFEFPKMDYTLLFTANVCCQIFFCYPSFCILLPPFLTCILLFHRKPAGRHIFGDTSTFSVQKAQCILKIQVSYKNEG